MAADITPILGSAGLNGESQSYASVVAQWAQGWERRLREEANGRSAEVVVPHVPLVQTVISPEESVCC